MINLLKIQVMDYDKLPSEYTIQYQTDIHFSNFDISQYKKKELIQLGYDETKLHIQQYKITNELLRPADKDPTEED